MESSDKTHSDCVGQVVGELVADANVLQFEPGQSLFYQEHNPYGVFVLVRGRVRLHEGGYRANGTGRMYMEANVPFGADLIQLGLAYPVSATAEEKSIVLFIPKSTILNRLK